MVSTRVKTLGIAAAFSLVCVVGLAACAAGGESSSSATSSIEGLTGGVAATVNGAEIMEDDVTEFVESYRATAGVSDEESWGTYLASSSMTPESFRNEVIDYFVSQELISQACEERGITATDEEVEEQVTAMRANYDTDEAWQAALVQAGTTEEKYRESVKNNILYSKLEEEVAAEAEPVSDEELLDYVKMYTDYFNGAKRSSHILFNSEDEETAKDVLARIKDGSLSFEDAVAEYSQDTGSAAKGGDVGWDTLSSYVAEYTDGLANLNKDEMSDLVKSDYGYHIIKVTDVFEVPADGVTSLDQVPEEMVDYIRSMMDSSAESNAITEWYDKYKEEAEIVVNDMPEGLPYDLDMTKYEEAAAAAAAAAEEAAGESSAQAEGEEAEGAEASADAEGAEASADEAASSDATTNEASSESSDSGESSAA